MAPKQQKQIKKQVVGQYFIAVIDTKKYTVTADKDLKELLKKEIDAYNLRNSEERLKKIIKLLQPKQEKEKQLAIVKKKTAHKKVKEAKKELKEADKEFKKEIAAVSMDATLDAEKEAFFKDRKEFTIKNGNLFLKPFTEVRMPQTLVNRFKEFIEAGTPLEPLINFWKLALLNPNEIARTKLFDYLTRQNLTITPAGYIVTYRMVKETGKKTPDGKPIYTSAHTGKEEYIMGTAYSIPREQCDEDGGRDCSKGLHTGTHKFIGILVDKKTDLSEGAVGQGYGTGTRITTKRETPDSYGTGYGSPKEVQVEQKFDNTFGNQAVICLVNPMHVVSVPDSDTRKMRSCELYFAGTTTAEEVIDLVEKDYHIFDHAYQKYEKEQIEKMLKETQLKEFFDNVKLAKTAAKKALAEKALRNAIANMTIGKDRINTNLLLPKDIDAIVKSRVIKKK